MAKDGRIGPRIGVTLLAACAAATGAGVARGSPSTATPTKLQSGHVCLGWRPHGPRGVAILAGGRCDRPAMFLGSPARPRPVAGFEGSPIPAGASATVLGWTPVLVSPDPAGAVRIMSPTAWPALGVSGSPVGSCLTVHRQAASDETGPLVADILPCEQNADDQRFDLRPAQGGGSRIISRQALENGRVCLTRPSRPGPPATFTGCSDDTAETFFLTPALAVATASNPR